VAISFGGSRCLPRFGTFVYPRAVSDFSAELSSLHPFFTLLGEAAATFVGLLFIAVTWNPHILSSQADPRFLNVAVNAFRDLLFIIVISLAILFPHIAP
jgi:hypothetical protein